MDVQKESPETSEKIREFSCNDNVGFDSLPHQIVKLRTHEGFFFNILLIGETGIGKSTLISSLFNIAPTASPDVHDNSEVSLNCQTYHLLEKEISLTLTVVETVGYGDQINRHENVMPIIDYIDSQFEKYFQQELKLKRLLDYFNDTRIHACLYFICPTGHNLKSIDVYCLKQLNDKVNIIPIIAKSDSLSKEELRRFKIAINKEIEKEGLKIYCFPTDDEEIAETNRKFNNLIPFAIAASENYAESGNNLKRARVFPWGTMQVENEEHNDFLALKRALMEVNMEDLKERTYTELYEVFRRKRLIELGFPEDETFKLQEFYQKKFDELLKDMKEKEQKLQDAFIDKVKAKEDEFKIQENLLHSKYDSIFEEMKSKQQMLISAKNFSAIIPAQSDIKIEQ